MSILISGRDQVSVLETCLLGESSLQSTHLRVLYTALTICLYMYTIQAHCLIVNL